MDLAGLPTRPSLFSRTLRDCRRLYLDSGQLIASKHTRLIEDATADFVQLMDDLHRGLVLKVYVTVCEADNHWSRQERLLAEVLCHHLWGKWLEGNQLRDAMKRASADARKLEWQALAGPFIRLEPLRPRAGDLETLVTRLANVVARCDGSLDQRETVALQTIEAELGGRLGLGVDPADAEPIEPTRQGATPQDIQRQAGNLHRTIEAAVPTAANKRRTPATDTRPSNPSQGSPEAALDDALGEMDRLIGLAAIKHEVHSLVNFLKLQRRRQEAGLPETEISLHLVFTGNPGTGKTTVARIVGKVFGALGVLEKGHLIETDRSGLVAEYAGQTGPKTNAKVDQALDGLLFIDEAYSLVARESEDPYGREAVQTLLKRTEDDRDRLVVILAGYPEEMHTLLRSNPGLSSRFSREFHFQDYTPVELARIFGRMCAKNRYELTPEARLKIMAGLAWMHGRRDRHFGNGRVSRNVFEHAVRRMANRLATAVDVTPEQLVTLEASDLEFPDAPTTVFACLEESQLQVRLECGSCDFSKATPLGLLGQRVNCPKCQATFIADWGELTPGGVGH